MIGIAILPGFKSYDTKLYTWIAIIYAVLLVIITFGFKDLITFDCSLLFQKVNAHLTSILIDFQDIGSFLISYEWFLVGLILLSSFFVLSIAPGIIRHGNNYISVLQKYNLIKIQEEKKLKK